MLGQRKWCQMSCRSLLSPGWAGQITRSWASTSEPGGLPNTVSSGGFRLSIRACALLGSVMSASRRRCSRTASSSSTRRHCCRKSRTRSTRPCSRSERREGWSKPIGSPKACPYLRSLSSLHDQTPTGRWAMRRCTARTMRKCRMLS